MSEKNTSKRDAFRRTTAPLLSTVIVSGAVGGHIALNTLTSDADCGAAFQSCTGTETARLDPPNDVDYTIRAPVGSSNNSIKTAVREGAKAPRGNQSSTPRKHQKTN